jgi:hypothetical protein
MTKMATGMAIGAAKRKQKRPGSAVAVQELLDI